jgi:hypothetical protein
MKYRGSSGNKLTKAEGRSGFFYVTCCYLLAVTILHTTNSGRDTGNDGGPHAVDSWMITSELNLIQYCGF